MSVLCVRTLKSVTCDFLLYPPAIVDPQKGQCVSVATIVTLNSTWPFQRQYNLAKAIIIINVDQFPWHVIWLVLGCDGQYLLCCRLFESSVYNTILSRWYAIRICQVACACTRGVVYKTFTCMEMWGLPTICVKLISKQMSCNLRLLCKCARGSMLIQRKRIWHSTSPTKVPILWKMWMCYLL